MADPGTDAVCAVCDDPPTSDNPLQVCHRIPFGEGIRRWRLTPDWLDRPDNLRWAHRKRCNKLVELPQLAAGELVRTLVNP